MDLSGFLVSFPPPPSRLRTTDALSYSGYPNKTARQKKCMKPPDFSYHHTKRSKQTTLASNNHHDHLHEIELESFHGVNGIKRRLGAGARDHLSHSLTQTDSQTARMGLTINNRSHSIVASLHTLWSIFGMTRGIFRSFVT